MVIERRPRYDDYDHYIQHQKNKTSSSKLRKRLQSKFEGKVKKFKSRFQHLKEEKIISDGDTVLCFGARMGEEVAAFREMNMNAIGVDLVPNLPLVEEGDFNNLKYKDSSHDIIYTNSLDHAWESKVFFDSVHRILKSEGVFIIDVFPGEGNYSAYEALFIGSDKDVENEVCEKGRFELLKRSTKLPNLQRRHKEIQLVFKKR